VWRVGGKWLEGLEKKFGKADWEAGRVFVAVELEVTSQNRATS